MLDKGGREGLKASDCDLLSSFATADCPWKENTVAAGVVSRASSPDRPLITDFRWTSLAQKHIISTISIVAMPRLHWIHSRASNRLFSRSISQTDRIARLHRYSAYRSFILRQCHVKTPFIAAKAEEPDQGIKSLV